jgi:hypothetical protein
MRAPHTEPDRDGDPIQMLRVALHIMAAAVASGLFLWRLLEAVL